MSMDNNHLHCYQLSKMYRVVKQLQDNDKCRHPIEPHNLGGHTQRTPNVPLKTAIWTIAKSFTMFPSSVYQYYCTSHIDRKQQRSDKILGLFSMKDDGTLHEDTQPPQKYLYVEKKQKRTLIFVEYVPHLVLSVSSFMTPKTARNNY